MSLYYVIVSWSAIDRHDWLWSGARGLLFWRKVLFEMPPPPPKKRKNYKGRNPNTLRYIESCGTEANSCQSRFGRKARRRKWRSGRWRKDLHPHWITLSTGIRALNSSKDKITNPKIKLLIKETMFCFNFVFCFNKTLSIYSQYRKNAGHAPSHSVVWSFLSWSEIKTCKFHPGCLDKATCLW